MAIKKEYFSVRNLIIAIVVIFGFLLIKNLFQDNDPNTVVDKTLTKFVKETNENCPQQLSILASLDSCSNLPGKIIQYHITISGFSEMGYTEEEFVKRTKEDILSNINQMPNSDFFIENNIRIRYLYYSQNGDLIGEVTIGPLDYINL